MTKFEAAFDNEIRFFGFRLTLLNSICLPDIIEYLIIDLSFLFSLVLTPLIKKKNIIFFVVLIPGKIILN